MAAELVGGAFLSSLFGKLFDKLESPDYFNFFRGLKLNDRLLKKLKIMLCSANQLLDDAEMKQFTNQNVREWLSELKDAIFVAEELLDDINYETLRYDIETKPASSFKKLKSTISSSYTTFDQAIEEILDRLEHIVKQKDVLGLKQGVTNSLSQRLPAPLANESHIYGRHGDKERIIELLLLDNGSSKDKISVIPIVGMGGIGKTTLAQLVYEDNRVKSHFHIRSWVTISDESDHCVITKKIVEEITSQKCGNEDLYKLQCKLKEAASEKRFLFVLDDVWNESYEHWEVLLSPLQYGAHGSRIIVTTRSENVARNMGNVPAHHLETISDDDCWMLFQKLVFENTSVDAHADLPEIGRDIVKKCKGVPLAVKSLAGLLRSVLDPMKWKEILNSDIWELQLQGNKSNNILPSLCLSYHHLPLHLKRCFAYCSIFPKDYKMNEAQKKRIILLWMAEGLLQPGRRGKQIEDVGNEYFEDLISRSLFQPLSKDKTTILMHDLTHDLAVFVSGEFSFGLVDGNKTKLSGKTRYFSYLMQDDPENFEGLSSTKCLRACLLLPHWGRPILQQQLLLPEGRCVRALSLCSPHSTALLDLIGNLKNLRYLDLTRSGIKEIPNSLCRLYNLQTLLLAWCCQLTLLPIDMGSLVSLRHLDIRGVPLEKMPPKMSNLKGLQALSNFILCKTSGSSIKELGGLHYLSGKLVISKLEIVDLVGDVWGANLRDKEYLNKLVYRWSSNHESRKDREVLDGLQPHTNLKKLVLNGYRGETFSNWVGHCSYNNMVTMHLHNCHSFSLPPLGQLASLQNLEVRHCRGVERIGAEFYSDGGSFNVKPYFESLKSLVFEDLQEWQEWSFPESEELGSRCFSSLEQLRIIDCPKLNLCLSEHFSSLTILEVRSNAQIAFHPEIQQIGKAFPSLELLNICHCPRLETFLLRNFPSNLKSLIISPHPHSFYARTKEVPPCLNMIPCENVCENVMAFPEALLPNTLTYLLINGLGNLKALNWESIHYLTCLEGLKITDCEELQCIAGEMLPTSLTSLKLSGHSKIEDLGKGLSHLTSLKKLKIYDCENLRSLSENGLPTSLTSLEIGSLESLEDIGRGFFRHLLILEELEIFDCKNLQYNNSNSLEEEENTGKRGLQHLISLETLTIQGSEGLQSLLEEGLPTSLTSLQIGGFPNLRDLNRLGFQHLNSLEELRISDCENLECLSEEGLASSLSDFVVYNCPLLKPRCQSETGQDWHKISHIPHVHVDCNCLARPNVGLLRS